ncbi:hypothetical protein Syun_001084 [Stephania yunnanensis]|uniref:Uncharacterized protein n=1 Tax=Stephania yunnanensis TaxID=152371 RepID=A0AAP0LH57_9MAGN
MDCGSVWVLARFVLLRRSAPSGEDSVVTHHEARQFGGGDGAGVGVGAGVACLAEQVGIVVLNNSTTSVLENINI